MQALLAFVTGWFAGLVHAWSGPDHLAAVAPLSVNRRKQPWTVGARWGAGHSAGVLLIGLVSIWFREALPLDTVSSVAERVVGVVLIGIGLWGIRKAFSERVHSHPHTHGSDSHAHFHVHGGNTVHPPEETPSHTHTHAALAVGALHGVAGSSHLIGVLPALAFPSALAAGSYLLGYAGGTVLGMAGFSFAIGWVQRWRAFAGTTGYSRLMCASSCVALGIGVYWIF